MEVNNYNSVYNWFNNLPSSVELGFKYSQSKYVKLANVFGYKFCDVPNAYKIDFDTSLKKTLINLELSVIMPNITRFNNVINGFVCRGLFEKRFINFKLNDVPYGVGFNNKPYNLPWLVVESHIDSDILRLFYPYVLASNGVHISNTLLKFIKMTSPYCLIGFDNDEAGNKAYYIIRKNLNCERFKVPFGKKDFGELLGDNDIWLLSQNYLKSYFLHLINV